MARGDDIEERLIDFAVKDNQSLWSNEKLTC
jgi:hypothetical protein